MKRFIKGFQPKKQSKHSIPNEPIKQRIASEPPAGQSEHSIPNNPRQAILAFRTITMMLSLIQHPTEITNSGDKIPLTVEQRNELKLLDSLAAVAVRKDEIVAVMGQGRNGHNIEVLLSVNNVDSPLNTQQNSKSHASWKNPIRWLITSNPRDVTWNTR
jgi:hypothetical protein